MEHVINTENSQAHLAEQTQVRPSGERWCVLIEETVVPVPQRRVNVSVLSDHAKIPAGNVLVRDHDGESDTTLVGEELLDLAEGNVFYVLPSQEAPPRNTASAPAKRAIFVDERFVLIEHPNHTGRTVRQLFGLALEVGLYRECGAPEDHHIGLEDSACFHDGPVFRTHRKHSKLEIIVNCKPFTEADGVKAEMAGAEIASLVTKDPGKHEVFQLPQETSVPLNQAVKIHNKEEFRVIRKDVAGGYEPARIQREIDLLRAGGARVTFVDQPSAAVIYHDLPTRPGYQRIKTTDVLVLVPNGYPGQPIDGAFLPQGSPLLGKVVGAPQNQLVAALGNGWQLVSYHPHAGGGGPPWNKDRNGFHTYLDEILTWLYRAAN